jgi:6-phosphogluconate dehydrogenase
MSGIKEGKQAVKMTRLSCHRFRSNEVWLSVVAGHFVKMVHNGIKYGLMAAYAEGLSVLRSSNVGARQSVADAETTPLRDLGHYQYDFDLRDIAEVWRRGSVVGSWRLDLTAAALARDSTLAQFKGHVSDSGEGR